MVKRFFQKAVGREIAGVLEDERQIVWIICVQKSENAKYLSNGFNTVKNTTFVHFYKSLLLFSHILELSVITYLRCSCLFNVFMYEYYENTFLCINLSNSDFSSPNIN